MRRDTETGTVITAQDIEEEGASSDGESGAGESGGGTGLCCVLYVHGIRPEPMESWHCH